MSDPTDEPAKEAAQAAAALDGLFPPPPGAPAEAIPAAATAAEEVEPPRPGVRKAAMQSALWLGFGFAAGTVLRLVSASILTRLLEPVVYALMDMANVFLQGLHMFSDVGIGQAVVQSKRGEERTFLNTAWTMHVVRGLILWLATFVIAWPVAAFYGQPVLIYLLPALGFTAALEGLKSTSLFTLDRRLLQGRAVLLDLTYAAIGIGVTVASARWDSPDVWALVTGTVVQIVFLTAVSHVLVRGYRDGFGWDRSAAKELFAFGKWIFLGTVITFLAFQADRLLLPKLTSLEEFGIYGRAGSLAGMATGLMSTFVGKLFFPVYSRLHQEGRDIRLEFGRVHSAAAGLAALLVIGMLSAGPALCWTLYGDAYRDSGWMLQIVAIGAWFQMLEGTIGASLLALGQAKSVTLGNFSRLVGVFVFVPLGYWLGSQSLFGSFIGVLSGFIAADIVRYLVAVYLARINGMWGVHYDVAYSLLILLMSPVANLAGAALARLMVSPDARPKIQTLVEFLCQGTLAVALWGAGFVVWWTLRKRRQGGGETP